MMRNKFRSVSHFVTKPELVGDFTTRESEFNTLIRIWEGFPVITQQVAVNWRSNSDLTSKFLLLCKIEYNRPCQRLTRLERPVGIIVKLYFTRSDHFGPDLFEFTLPHRLSQRQLVASGAIHTKTATQYTG